MGSIGIGDIGDGVNNKPSSSNIKKGVISPPDTDKVIPPPPSHKEATKHPRNDYIKFPNFMAPQVGGKSKGLFEKFESKHEHELVQMYCDSLKDECIGYAFNKNAGFQFYSPAAFPVAKKNGWDFYMKQDPNKPLSFDNKGLTMDDMDDKHKEIWKDKVEQQWSDDDENEEDEDKDNDKEDTKKPKKSQRKSIKEEIENDTKDEIRKKYAPTVSSGDEIRYISYAQNVGRVNNQLVSFEAMIQYAIYYNRTLVIPWPRHQNHVMGFECGFWDFDRLSQVIDIIMEDELPERLQNYLEEDALPKECRYIKLVGKGIPNDKNIECEMIYLYEGDMGIFHFRAGPQDVMKYIIPAKYIRDAVEDFLIQEFGELKYRIGVHRRAMDEGGM